MRYYKGLFLSPGLEKKRDKIVRKLEQQKFQLSIHLIILSQNEKNHLEILNSVLLMQKDFPIEDYLVVGISKSYDEAIELVEKITKEVYDSTKDVDIRKYILKKEQED